MGIFKVFKALFVAIPFIVPFALLLESEGKPGPEKRAEVVRLLKEELEKLDLSFPSWISGFVDPLLGLLVDVVVGIMNKTGFFSHGETSLED